MTSPFDPRPKAMKTVDSHSPLPPAAHRFAEEYLIDFSVDGAAQRLGIRRAVARNIADHPGFPRLVEAGIDRRATRMEIRQDYVLDRWLMLERADPRELVEHWRVPCRACWGFDHQYQYTDIELRDAQQAHRCEQEKLAKNQRRVFDDKGGGGYTILKDPCRGPDWVAFHQRRHPDGEFIATADHTCPGCHGEGYSHVYVHDTRYLSPSAALLFKGIEATRHGYKVLMRDQDEARSQIARHLGYFLERNAIDEFDPKKLTDEQLDLILGSELAQRANPVAEGDGLDHLLLIGEGEAT